MSNGEGARFAGLSFALATMLDTASKPGDGWLLMVSGICESSVSLYSTYWSIAWLSQRRNQASTNPNID
jgi:hypothetical protein